jgi:hypothetical protein
MLTGLVGRRPKAIATVPGSKGCWSHAYAASDRGNGQQLLFHGAIVS